MTAEELAEIRKRQAQLPKSHWKQANFDLETVLTHTDAQAQRIAELEAQLAACEQRLDHTLIAYQEAVSGVPDTAKINYESSQRLISDCQLAARGPTKRELSREVMMAVQFRDFGHFEDDPDEPGERVYVTTGEQTDNLQQACDEAAERILALLSSGALATAHAVTLTEEERETVESYRKSTWMTARKLLAIIDRLTNGASTPAHPTTESAWQPIETAPLDGTSILLFTKCHGVVEAWFAKGEWSEETPISPSEYSGSAWVCADDAFQIEVEETSPMHHGTATHWMPLPAHPTQEGEKL